MECSITTAEWHYFGTDCEPTSQTLPVLTP
jgi:hypothetical protein